MNNEKDISPLEKQLKSKLQDLEMAPSRDFFDAINEKSSQPKDPVSNEKTTPKNSKLLRNSLVIGTSVTAIVFLLLFTQNKEEIEPETTNDAPAESSRPEPLKATTPENQELNEKESILSETTNEKDETVSEKSNTTQTEIETSTILTNLSDEVLEENIETSTESNTEVNETSNWQEYLNSNTDTTDLQDLFEE